MSGPSSNRGMHCSGHRRRRRETLSEIEDNAFTLAGDFGQVTKQQPLDQVRRRQKPQVVSRTIDKAFRFYGDVALLTEVDHARDAEGKADFQATILWVGTEILGGQHICTTRR
jgi:hypothetical protein